MWKPWKVESNFRFKIFSRFHHKFLSIFDIFRESTWSGLSRGQNSRLSFLWLLLPQTSNPTRFSSDNEALRTLNYNICPAILIEIGKKSNASPCRKFEFLGIVLRFDCQCVEKSEQAEDRSDIPSTKFGGQIWRTW